MVGSAYISKRLELRPRDLPEAATSWHRGLKSVRLSLHFVRGSRYLWLSRNVDGLNADPLRLYGVRGVLWVNGRPVRVTLEFSCWSDSASEVGVRPSGVSWPVGSELYDRQVDAVLDAVSRSICSQATQAECPSQDSRIRHPGNRTNTPIESKSTGHATRATSKRLARSRSKSRIKRVALATGSIVFAIFLLAAAWVGITIYRIDHAIHHVAIPASLISNGHDDLLVMVKGANDSEQILIRQNFRGHERDLQVPNALLLPLAGGKSAQIDTLSLQRPAIIISGLERLGLPISGFVGLDLHMFSSTSIVGRLASGQASASSLLANPMSATSILEQIASHIYLGPGTPMSAVMSLTSISASHVATIPTKADPLGRTVLAATSVS